MRSFSRTVMVGTLLLVSGLLVTSCGAQKLPTQDGLMDLSSWNFSSHPQVALNGTWEMWWSKLITPSEIGVAGPGQSVSMPRFWNSLPQPYPALGSATFRLRLKLPNSVGHWLLRVPNIHCAYTLYINGQKVLQMGNPSLDPRLYRDALRPRVVPFTVRASPVEILINVVNESDMYGGFRRPFVIGPQQTLLARYDINHSLAMAVSGALLSLGLLQLFVFFLQPYKWSHLWLSLFSFCITWRGLSTGDRLMAEIFPQVPFVVWSKLEYLAVFLGVIFVSFYLQSLYRSLWPKRIVLPFLGYTVLFAGLNIFLPLETFAYLFPFYEIPLLGVVVIFFVVPLRGARRRHRGSWIVMSGILILAIGAVNDLLYLGNLVSTGYILDKTLLVFMLFQSFLLSRQLADDYHIIESQVKEQLAVSKLKDEFLARVSHELRTPLYGMLGIADTLEKEDKGSLTPGQKYHISLLNQVSQRLLEMVTKILDFSDLKGRKVSVNLTAVPLKAAIDFLMPYFHQNDAVPVINAVRNDFPPVAGDLVLIQQLIYQLVENAIKHTEAGTVRLEATVLSSRAAIHITDTGKGIPKTKQALLFESFHQGEDAETRTKAGLGLGLAHCREIVQQMNGSISLTSEEKKGTTVTFTLPWATPEHPSSNPPEKTESHKNQYIPVGSWARSFASSRTLVDPPARSDEGGAQKTLLLVDDEPVNIILLRNFLKPTGFCLLEARNGFEALELMKKQSIDLMILDIMMPGMSGYEVCHRVREFHSSLALPIILLTAKSSIDDIQRGLECGANDYMTKPVAREEILERVKQHLGTTEKVNAPEV
ncbi:MAG: response regulator [Spirochaetales bacterium]|nr:response regulator [Spirochaetales bacterium]